MYRKYQRGNKIRSHLGGLTQELVCYAPPSCEPRAKLVTPHAVLSVFRIHYMNSYYIHVDI